MNVILQDFAVPEGSCLSEVVATNVIVEIMNCWLIKLEYSSPCWLEILEFLLMLNEGVLKNDLLQSMLKEFLQICL